MGEQSQVRTVSSLSPPEMAAEDTRVSNATERNLAFALSELDRMAPHSACRGMRQETAAVVIATCSR